MDIQKIADFFETFAPKNLAESWDNTGVLIDSKTKDSSNKKVLLTIDFTESVLQECIEKDIKNVISYHPVLFHSIKRIDSDLLIRTIQNNISVFSPHTQLDKLMNLFLQDLIGPDPGSFEEIVKKVKKISGLQYLRVVQAENGIKSYKNNGDIHYGVGSAFKNVELTRCMLITGEMSHHDLLKCRSNNIDVILMEHSNSERIFLGELKRICEEMKEYEFIISGRDIDPIKIV